VSVEKVETLIVGGGQAGLAMSEQLSKRGLPHLVLERHRIAERWRTERWDGLHANGPAWHDRLPGLTIPGVDPDGFATRDQMVDYFIAYAEHIAAPMRCGVEVTALRQDGASFRAETSGGPVDRAFPAPDRPGRRPGRRGRPSDPFQRIQEPRTTPRGRGAGCRLGFLGRADRR
jgi:putative flavoprotein involved in K+ transport